MTTPLLIMNKMNVKYAIILKRHDDFVLHCKFIAELEIMKNGNREKVTSLDLELGNVCPNKTKSQPSAILSVQQRSDGQFDVVCKDLTRVVADATAIMQGAVCKSVVPQSILTNGDYKAVSGYTGWCPQSVVAESNNNQLTSVKVTFLNPCGGETVQMACENLQCSGTLSGYTYTVNVNTLEEYVFDSTSRKSPGTFKLIK